MYHRLIGELVARHSPLWLVFTPLTRDATAADMSRVLEMLRAEVPIPEERGELFTALLVMADLDPWGHNLREEIVAMIQRSEEDRLILESRTLREVFEKELVQRHRIEVSSRRNQVNKDQSKPLPPIHV